MGILTGRQELAFGEVGTTQETMESLYNHSWDILILEILLAGRGGLEVLHEVKRHWPRLPVLVLSSAWEEHLALRVLKLGAAGCLNKTAPPEEVVTAARRVLGGGRYVSESTAEDLAAGLGGKSMICPHERLSAREFQVLQLLVAGRSIREAAGELCLSPKTVSSVHTRVWEKLDVKNDVQLVHYALRHNLIPPSALPIHGV